MSSFYIANSLMFIVGTTLTWSSSELPKLNDEGSSPFHKKLSIEEQTWVSSLVTLGAAVGPFLFTYLADKMGRKYTLLSIGVPFLVSYVMLAFGKFVEIFYTARFVAGLAVGGAFTVMPIYAGELAEKSNRGYLGFLMGSAVCSGFLFSCSLGPYVSVVIFNLILAVFSLVFLVLFLLFGKEVPHYYVIINDENLAKDALQKLRGSCSNVNEELGEILSKFKEESQGTFLDIFKSRGLIRAFITCVGLLMFQQFSGVNAVLFYGQQIFQEVGSNLPPEISTIIIAGVQFLSSSFAPIIGDRVGKKPILICSAIGMMLSETALGTYIYLREINTINMHTMEFCPLVFMTTYIIFYNSGYGPLPWAMLGEMFPNRVKSISTSSVASINWLMAFFFTKHFETMITLLGIAWYFWLLAGCCFGAAIFAKFYVVETRGRSLKEIQEILNR